MGSSSDETKDTICRDYVLSLMKLKIKNLIFPITILWQALTQSSNK